MVFIKVIENFDFSYNLNDWTSWVFVFPVLEFENNVFVGSHCVIKGGAHIGHHSVIAAGTIVEGVKINPYSLVIGNPMQIKDGFYKDKIW